MLEHTSVSERRACRLAGLSRDAFRHEPVPTPATQALSARLIELAQVRRRFGYRRLYDLLKPEFPTVNHKKVYRLYQEAKLSVRRRRKAKRPVGERQKLLAACAPNATWSMDFVFDALANGRRIKCLTIVDDFTRTWISRWTTASAASTSCACSTKPRASVATLVPYARTMAPSSPVAPSSPGRSSMASSTS